MKSLGGTLVLVPLFILLFGSYWEWDRFAVLAKVELVEPGGEGEQQPIRRTVRLHFYDDGADPGRGVALPRGSYLDVALSRSVDRFKVAIQVDFNDVYEVLASANGSEFARLWLVPRGHKGSYLTTRQSPWLDLEDPIRLLRVRALRGNSPHVVAGLRLELEPLETPQALLIPLLWGLALALWAIGTLRSGGWSRGVLRRWQEADLWLAAILTGAVVLRIPRGTLIVVVAILVFWAVFRLLSLWWARSPASLFAVITVTVLLVWLVPTIFEALIVARIAELHDLTVDHRPLPGPDVNSDRIRFAAEAGDIGKDDFVVMFAGDSFTYGLGLEYEEAYPYVFEQLVAELECSRPVRAVNIGWTSASPLLTLRLLREIGYKYEPDLVIYNLDVTDFHDDLSYEARLKEGGDLEIDPREAALLLVSRAFPKAIQYLPDPDQTRELFRRSDSRDGLVDDSSVPKDRFFVTNQPLEDSIEDIERGVVANLEKLDSLVSETLGSSMVLVVYPRAYQYSMRESPRNWEAHLYEVLGPYVREPFRYLSREAERLSFPVLSLLDAFEETDEFPLFMEDDPHWNATGARFIAALVAEWAAESSLIPCRPVPR